MKLNTLIRGLSLFAALSTASLFANSVVISHDAPAVDSGTGGGEFLATLDGNVNFLTFCMESHVHITPGEVYTYTIDSTVLLQNDAISVGSAYLYDAFLDGALSGPTGTYVGANLAEHTSNAALLQHAFWMLEGEETIDNSNFYISLVTGMFANAYADSDITQTRVRALNIWGVDDAGALTDKQSMLVRIPDAGVTVALLGLGLLSLAAFRRKL